MAGTVLLYAIDILFHPLPPAVSELFQKFASCSIFFGAAALCVMKGRASRDERSAWWLFALAMALWGTAALYYAVVLWDRKHVPYPSVADGFWLAFYLPAYAALYRLLRKRAGSFGKGVWLDALVGGLGVGGAGAALVFQGVLEHTDGTALATATNLAYPVGDLGLLALVVAAITVTGWKASGVWRWIAPAFAIFAVADSIYLVQVAEGTYAPGGIVDLGWPTAALLVGLAAWRPEARVRPGVRTGATIVVPAVSGFAALALLVVDHFVRTNPLALGLATASIFVMLVRLYLTVQDNARMLAQSRREATTDALTGLGNRRQLTADLAAHLDDLDPERPLMLTLFDLDGFKQYNDTFGHPAGDQLLSDSARGSASCWPGAGPPTGWAATSSARCGTCRMTARRRSRRSKQWRRFPNAVRRSRSDARTAPCCCRTRRPTQPTRCGWRTGACTSARAAGARRPGGRAPTSCCGRSPNATRSSAFTWAAWRSWRVRPRCGSAFPRKTWKRRGRPRSSTTSARSRSPTRS